MDEIPSFPSAYVALVHRQRGLKKQSVLLPNERTHAELVQWMSEAEQLAPGLSQEVRNKLHQLMEELVSLFPEDLDRRPR